LVDGLGHGFVGLRVTKAWLRLVQHFVAPIERPYYVRKLRQRAENGKREIQAENPARNARDGVNGLEIPVRSKAGPPTLGLCQFRRMACHP